MDALAAARCRLHPSREAVARCPSCGGFFCRECVTEHGGRFVCAACLRAAAVAAPRVRRRWEAVGIALQGALGLALLWLLVYAAGRALILLPASFHEGTLWGLQ